MSMICWVLAVSDSQIAAIRANPSLTSALTLVAADNEFPPPPSGATLEPYASDLREMVAQARAAIVPLGPLGKALSLEKSWHMLHFAFTGDVLPVGAVGDALLTGEEVGDDVGYGPVRVHDPEATAVFSAFLEAQHGQHLAHRLSLADMQRAGVYSIPDDTGGDTEYENSLRTEASRYFALLRDYVAEAARQRGSLVIWVS